jgi:hypothetical protein
LHRKFPRKHPDTNRHSGWRTDYHSTITDPNLNSDRDANSNRNSDQNIDRHGNDDSYPNRDTNGDPNPNANTHTDANFHTAKKSSHPKLLGFSNKRGARWQHHHHELSRPAAVDSPRYCRPHQSCAQQNLHVPNLSIYDARHRDRINFGERAERDIVLQTDVLHIDHGELGSFPANSNSWHRFQPSHHRSGGGCMQRV